MDILKTKSQNLIQKIENAPKEPGCYIYRDEKNEIIYVGKAKILRNRVKSYFKNFTNLDLKTQALVEKINDVEFLTVDSEVEALILETNLIKKYKPHYNIALRDDKSYSWVKFENVEKGVNDYPRIRIIRNTDKDEDGEYFGPYLDTVPLKSILKKIRKTFPYASCNRRLVQVSEDPLKVDTNNSKPCLYYHLGLCSAPCASLQSKKDYLKNFNNIKKIFSGDKNDILRDLEKEMNEFSQNKEFEKAAKTRDRIKEIKYITQNIRIDNEVDDELIAELKRTEKENGLIQLIEELRFPQEKLSIHSNFRIECYDISNIQGTNAVGAMTVSIDGKLRPDLYRKFRINRKQTPDDFAMLQEVLTRRFRNLDSEDESFSQKPDLIIIDGGKGQLSAAYKILRQLGVDMEMPVVGLAKKEEEIFKLNYQFAEEGSYQLTQAMFGRVYLPRKSEALYLVQRIRDEAHRFGITYHRKLRSKKMLT